MKFVQLTRSDDEPIWVNMGQVHFMVRSDDVTVLHFAPIPPPGGLGIWAATAAVKEPPHDIFRKV